MATMNFNRMRDVDVVIDKANDNFIAKQWTSVGDKKGRTLTTMVTNGGIVGEVPGVTVSLYWTNLANGITDEHAFVVKDKATSQFIIEFPDNMLTKGKVIAQIRIWFDGKVVSTKPFEIEVGGIAGQMAGVVKQQEFGLLTAVLADANNFRYDINRKADKTYVDTVLSSIAAGGPKELFYSLNALKVKYPQGAEGTYLVFDASHTDGAHSYMWKDNAWNDLGVYQGLSIPDKSITSDKIANDSNIVISESKNLIDLTKTTKDYYVAHESGQLYASSNYEASDFIYVETGASYTLSTHDNTDVRQLAFYDSQKKYISGLPNTAIRPSVTFITPPNAKYIRATIHKASLEATQLEKGTTMTPYQKYKKEVPKNLMPFDINKYNFFYKKITVKKTGGDFASIKKALEYAEKISNEFTKVVVEVYEGTYSVFDDYTDAEINVASFRGPAITNNVTLVGIGDFEKIIIKGELSSTIALSQRRLASTLNMIDNSDLKNVTVTAKNIRYAVHDDQGANVTKTFDNVVMIQQDAEYGGGCALGGGTHTGSRHIFNDCTFVQEMTITNDAWSYHNNVGFVSKSVIICNNCKFLSKNGISNVKLYSMGSGVADEAIFNNCQINGKIVNREHFDTAGIGIDFIVKGHGTIVPIENNSFKSGQQVVNHMTGLNLTVFNASGNVIGKGMPVMLNENRNSIVLCDNAHLCIGVAMETIGNNASGVVQTKGFVQLKDTILSNVVIGDFIGINNNQLAIVSDRHNAIGIVVDTLFIKLF
ncbi:hypothetical protein [Enterococcus saccharolyticus]|uniref:hypothetical protein n=1 Tax=Enterococcus saccharolyticus TaxID=41997 RepID=UPI0039DFCAD8